MKLKLLTSIPLFIAGCATAPQPSIAPLCEKPIVLNPPPANAVQLKSVKFYVVSEKNLDVFLAKIESTSDGVFYAITPEGYENLAYNVQELRRYIREAQNTIIFYRNANEPSPNK